MVEIDKENVKKDIEALDIEIPVLTPRVYREYKNLADLDVTALGHQHVTYLQFSEEEQREIVFKDITTGEVQHTTSSLDIGRADRRLPQRDRLLHADHHARPAPGQRL